MKTIAKLVIVVLVVLLAIPVVKYRTLNPCKALKKERIEQWQQGVEAVSEAVQEAAGEYGERVARVARDGSEAVQETTAEFAEAVIDLELEEMSARQCVAELWKLRNRDRD